MQEREFVARRLLPILLASENDLYRNDNLQKLALRLRIGERDLLMWAQEQQKIAAAKPPRQLELPPPDLDLGDEPPDFAIRRVTTVADRACGKHSRQSALPRSKPTCCDGCCCTSPR
ncbi:MAG: hypothetical protein U0703_29630 [Anaerolineae bacterium]